MIKSGGDECKRAKGVLKSISMEHPDVIHSFSQEQEHAPKCDGRMESDDVLSMMFEANVKCRKLRVINRHLKCSSGGVKRAKRRMLANQ